MAKLGIGVLVAAAVAALLVVLAAGARERGRLTHCRNNLRKLGELAHQKLAAGESTEASGREFWQEVRREHFSRIDPRRKKDVWFVKFGGLNPFGCPVRGVQPEDLAALVRDDAAAFEKLMTDPATIDYSGPKAPPTGDPGRRVLGADRPGNHKDGGHVLRADFSVQELGTAVDVTGWKDVPGAAEQLKD